MSEKVILTKEQAEALELALKYYAKTSNRQKIDVVRVKLSSRFDGVHKELNELDPDTLIRALYIGYEVDKTPEEKVREYYEELSNKRFNSNIYVYKMGAVQKTLDLLGIKISGVNDVRSESSTEA